MYMGQGWKGWVTQGTSGYSAGVGGARAGASGTGSLVESGAQHQPSFSDKRGTIAAFER